MRALVLYLALGACGPITPEDRGIEVDRSIVKVYNQDKAMLLFESMVEDATGHRFGDAFEDARVWWTTTICPYSDDPAVIYRGRCNYGRMWSCGEIYVALPMSGITCGSALIHEFAHCLSMLSIGHGDAGHTGPLWPIVADAHEASCEREGAVLSEGESWRDITAAQIDECEEDFQ